VSGFPTPFTKGPLCGVQSDYSNRAVERMVDVLGILLVKTNIIKNAWELREILKLPPASPMDAVRRKYGVKGLREAYEENLITVLEYVAELSREILHADPSSKIVITADHGELLGEDRKYAHPYGSRDPILVEVPWFKIKNVKRVSSTVEVIKKFNLPMINAERERVKDEIKKLKKSGNL